MIVIGFLSKVILGGTICDVYGALNLVNLLAADSFVMAGCVLGRSVDGARFWGDSLFLYSLYLFGRLARPNH